VRIPALVSAALLLALLSAGAEAAAPKRVLLLHSFGRDFAPDNGTASALRADLTLREPVALEEASLDVERGAWPENEGALVEYLMRRSRDALPDLVIPLSAPAMFFALRHREALFPDRPILVSGVDRRWFEATRIGERDRVVTLGKKDRAVTMGLDFLATARNALELLPDTTTIALVMGSSRLEQIWAKDIQLELAPLGDRVRVLPPDALSLEQMRQRLAALPPNTAVVYGMFAVGTDGAQYENEVALVALRGASSAPVFGIYASQLGNGIVGGSLVDARQIGSVTAELAVRMLRGESTSESSVNVPQQAPTFDWRELQHWGIAESRLPPGAEVQFRPPSVWEQHKVLILTGLAIVLVQAALINALLLQRARLRRSEKEAAGLSGRLITAHEDERKRLARELHDDLTQRLARLAIDAGRMENAAAAPAGMRPLREDLVRLSEDVHAMSYRLHPSVLDDLGLVEALKAECDRVARQGALRVEVDVSGGVPGALSAETSLCLFRVLQEALSNATRHARASAVTVLLSPSGKGLQLAVSDNGGGFDQAQPREHTSLGLASMRERVRLLQGHFAIASTRGRGTTVVAWVPT
jgi:signal transduction histidine kinase